MFRYVPVVSLALATYGLPLATDGERYAQPLARREEKHTVPAPLLGAAYDHACACWHPCPSTQVAHSSPAPPIRDILPRYKQKARATSQDMKPHFPLRDHRRLRRLRSDYQRQDFPPWLQAKR